MLYLKLNINPLLPVAFLKSFNLRSQSVMVQYLLVLVKPNLAEILLLIIFFPHQNQSPMKSIWLKTKIPNLLPLTLWTGLVKGTQHLQKVAVLICIFPLPQNNIKHTVLVQVYRKPHGVYGMPLKWGLCLWDAVGKAEVFKVSLSSFFTSPVADILQRDSACHVACLKWHFQK